MVQINQYMLHGETSQFIYDQYDEREWQRGRFRDFLHLSESEQEELKERIEKNDGLLRIFVHPFFEHEDNGGRNRHSKIRAIDRAIRKWIALESEQTPPILFMEEEHMVEKFKDMLQGAAENKV